MRGIVWGKSLQRAIPVLETIKNAYLLTDEEVIHERKNSTNYIITFSNGDHWEAVGANENRRGKRANVSYVDAYIDPRIMDEVIKPATVALPYHAINYFYPREDEQCQLTIA